MTTPENHGGLPLITEDNLAKDIELRGLPEDEARTEAVRIADRVAEYAQDALDELISQD